MIIMMIIIIAIIIEARVVRFENPFPWLQAQACTGQSLDTDPTYAQQTQKTKHIPTIFCACSHIFWMCCFSPHVCFCFPGKIHITYMRKKCTNKEATHVRKRAFAYFLHASICFLYLDLEYLACICCKFIIEG